MLPRQSGLPPIRAEEFIVRDDADFVRALRLDSPALAPVREARERQGPAAAMAAFICRFRAGHAPLLARRSGHRKAAHAQTAPHPAFNTAPADAVLAGHIDDGYCSQDVGAGGIDWRHGPLHCITRFPSFRTVLAAHRHTGAAKYARFIVKHGQAYMAARSIEEFIGRDTLSYAPDGDVRAPWEWSMIHNRLGTWAEAVAQLRTCPDVTDAEILAILRRMLEEMRFLLRCLDLHVRAKSNSGGTMLLSVLIVAELMEDFTESAAWQDRVAARFPAFLEDAFYPDGLFRELTVGYSVELDLTVQLLAERLIERPGAEAWHDRLRAIYGALAGMSRPDGSLPPLGDSWPCRVSDGVAPRLATALGCDWVTRFSGARAPEPPFLSWPAPGQPAWGGYYAMRSAWSPKANYLLVDGGPWGLSHMHCDRLSLVVSADGAHFLVDPANTTYESNDPAARISLLYAGFLHNTLVVDGADEFIAPPGWWETAAPLANRWEQGSAHVLFCGAFDFAPVKAVRWERRVLFVDGAYWLVQDVLTGEPAEVEVEQNFQFDEDIRVRVEDRAVRAEAPGGERFALVLLGGPLAPVLTTGDGAPHPTRSTAYYASTEPRLFDHGRGWVGRGIAIRPAPAATYVGRVRLPAMLTVALVPGSADALAAGICREETERGTIWSLPARSGRLRWDTGPDGCSVREAGA